MRSMLVSLVVMGLALGSCSSSEPDWSALPAIDLVDPCTLVSADDVSSVAGTRMVRSAAGGEDNDFHRVCRWVEDAALAELPTDEYVDAPAREYVDIVVRRDDGGDALPLAEIVAFATDAENVRAVSDLRAPDLAGGADEVVRAETTLWALKDDRLLVVATNSESTLDLLVDRLLAQVVSRI